MDKIIYGGDTETIDGKPLSMQFYSEDVACSDMIFCNEKTAREKFLAWCGKRRPKYQHVVYVHNLAFDLIEFLWGAHSKLISDSGSFEFSVSGWRVTGVYGTPTYCKLTKANSLSIILIDSFSFFRGSLAHAAEIFCPNLPKLVRPEGLGKRRFTSRDTKFCAYAMRDSEVSYHIGRSIERLHQEFECSQSVSVADMASRIFRHRFLSYTIPQPADEVVQGALLSYHGGKNNITVGPGWYLGVSSLDISSAFPEAMHALPAFSSRKYYRRYQAKGGTRLVPNCGVYQCSGTVNPCKWPSLFSHGFKPLSGRIDGVWVQGFELNEALCSGEFKATKLKGWMYESDRDLQAPALRAYVDDFYERKETEKDKVLRYMYKLLLNSLYGKFIQTRKSKRTAYYDVSSEETTTAADLEAGGMFHPFIASAITARPRATIHRLEHKYKALHTATDGIFTQARVVGEKKKLGAVTLEGKGDLLLIRNKLYVLYGPSGERKSTVFKGKRIIKQALHGFQGNVFDLERLIATNRRAYQVNRPNRLKESLKRGLTPNKFERREFTLKVGPLEIKSSRQR